MTNQELQQKVINATTAVEKRKAVLEKHRAQLAKMIAKGADHFSISCKQSDIESAIGKAAESVVSTAASTAASIAATVAQTSTETAPAEARKATEKAQTPPTE